MTGCLGPLAAPAPVFAQTVEVSLPSPARQPGDLVQQELKRIQDLTDSAQRKRKAGQAREALIDVEAALLILPRDPSLRFLRAVILQQSGNDQAALEGFEELTQDYPELAEPHNNAAVIYAKRQELDKARAALQRALLSSPNYAVAHENLGDIYIAMAARAYNAANRLPGRSPAVGNKLRVTTEWLKSTTLNAKQ